ncbi:MAG: hypothetical protein H6621_06305 [Halobacteriovoraceae bacterium]|nr:hypothetical protein [Halobacteriovoraceae bacterium]
MKSTIIATFALSIYLGTSQLSFAAPRVVCQEYDTLTKEFRNRTIVLEPIGDEYQEEGYHYASDYSFQLFEACNLVPDIELEGTGYYADDLLQFHSKPSHDIEVSMHVFFDDPEKTVFYLDGEEQTNFVCH